MTQETTSFVLRFVREMSEEQGARWRGLVQHVQSGAESNFASFAEAVKFMQRRVLESTAETIGVREEPEKANLFIEMARMWGDIGQHMTEMWTDAAAQMMSQSAAFRSQLDQAAVTALKAWRPSTQAEHDAVLAQLTGIADQIDLLAARVEELETELVAQKSTSERRHSDKRTADGAAE